MKKPLIITVAVAILLLVIGVWVYLFMFGAPENRDDVFTNLGFDLGSQPVVVPTDTSTTGEALIDTQSGALRQLTTRPVAGFGTPANSSSTVVRYVEQGTGHVYEIDINSGAETRLSNTTVPRVVEAVFNPTATAVALTSESGYTADVFVGTVADSALTGTSLPPDARNVTFIDNTSLGYTRLTSGETTGYRYNLNTNDQVIDFVVPFLAIRTIYTPAETFVYNRHEPELEGTLFRVTGTDYQAVLPNAFGTSAMINPTWYVQSYTRNNEFFSRALTRETNTEIELPVNVIPEKCSFAVNTLWCGAPLNPINYQYQKQWYQGVVNANDVIWEIDIPTQTARLAIDPERNVGRAVDMLHVYYDTPQNLLYFQNKNDNTLWLYDPSVR